ncbi:hypothetical protein DFA_06993 [Cavenderia fasciculata]|uniref:Ependymin-related protein n=1 Tax=Cavenderia fasciculata TaxID=261658 RepID=F4PX86_CACFS|nr:uncharacterized protein DFA_06993 [Cavenderia fasciculata]EGG19889.1 hypothetical protein DFA_06993 [Cavenderia fasciculata]|eukprot:XP_004366872.1 hypothetical protein DFA_06993 [Cavenderia fasciculata]
MFISRIAILLSVAFAMMIGVQAQNCLKSNGYTAGFTVTSFNTYYPAGGAIEPLSFFEVGDTSVDYDGLRMRVNYEFTMAGQPVANGSLWGFGTINKMYILSQGVCTIAPLSFPIQTLLNGSVVGMTKLGQLDVQVWKIAAGGLPTNQELFYDNVNCAGVSSLISNADPSTPGYSTMLFFDFVDQYTESYFDLPSQCTQPDQIATFTNGYQEKETFPHIPKSLHHLLRSGN